MAMSPQRLVTLSLLMVLLISLKTLAIVRIRDAAVGCVPQSCNGIYGCSSTNMNFSVNVSEMVQTLVASDTHQAALQFSWQPPPDSSAAGALGYKLCVVGRGYKSGCSSSFEIVRKLQMNTTQCEVVDGKIRFQCPYLVQIEFLSASKCQGCATIEIPQLVVDLYENDPVMFANFSSTPDIETGWYELVVNLTLSLSSSPYLAAGTPCVELTWAEVPPNLACQPSHHLRMNRLALFRTQDLLGVWNSTTVSLPQLSDKRYEVAARACECDRSFLYKQPAMVCRSFAAPVLLPAAVEGVWSEVWANTSGQLNFTVGWDARVASYGKMEHFEVEVITESSVRPRDSSFHQVSGGNSSKLNVSVQLPSSRENVLTRVRAVSEYGAGDWSHEVLVYDSSLQASLSTAEATPPPAPPLVAIIVPLVIALVFLAFGLLCVVVRIAKRKGSRSSEQPSVWYRRPACLWDESALADAYEVDPSDIIRNEEMDSIGDGSFGSVWLGSFHGQAVAIKTMKRDVESSTLASFLAEIQMMKRVSRGGCPHVVNLVAASSYADPVLMVMELAAYGNLLDYLRRSRQHFAPGFTYGNVLNLREMLDIATQIAKGMEYLASQNVIHCDLACRNVLLGDSGFVKVCDFGLSRATSLYIQCAPKPVPIRWMAPESIAFHRFTTKSDVWSFGVTVWEIYSLGRVPYKTLDNHSILPYLQDGHRLLRPAHSSDAIHALMTSCWMGSPQQRPTFSLIVSVLEEMESTAEDGHVLEAEEDEEIDGLDYEQEGYVDITTASLAPSHIEEADTAWPSESLRNGDGDVDTLNQSELHKQEEHGSVLSLPLVNAHFVETASECLRNGGDGNVDTVSQSQLNMHEGHRSILSLPPVVQLPITEADATDC